MRVIGLTGGVGSGKSLAAEYLKEITGGELLIADKLGHEVIKSGTCGYKKIVECFGKKIISDDGEIDRKLLGEICFNDAEKMDRLNKIVHPEVLNYIKDYIYERRLDEGIIVLESAIMFESGCDRFCDEIWLIWVPDDLRIDRLMKSRGYSREKCVSIINNQLSKAEFEKKCTKVIENTGTEEKLKYELNTALQ